MDQAEKTRSWSHARDLYHTERDVLTGLAVHHGEIILESEQRAQLLSPNRTWRKRGGFIKILRRGPHREPVELSVSMSDLEAILGKIVAEAAPEIRAGLLALRYQNARRPVRKPIDEMVRARLGGSWTRGQLRRLASQAQAHVNEQLRKRFGHAVSWQARHLPEISKEKMPALTQRVVLDGSRHDG